MKDNFEEELNKIFEEIEEQERKEREEWERKTPEEKIEVYRKVGGNNESIFIYKRG